MGSAPGATTIRKCGEQILAQTSKPELAHYLHSVLFRPITASLLKEIKKYFVEDLAGSHRKINQETP